MVAICLNLDKTPATNGALRVIPASHKAGRIELGYLPEYDTKRAVDCECMAGDGFLMSPLLLHASRRSASPTRRRVIHSEYAPDEHLDPALE